MDEWKATVIEADLGTTSSPHRILLASTFGILANESPRIAAFNLVSVRRSVPAE